jgi:hypothetical protein
LTLIIAYLEHDPGETGAARAATRSGTSDDTTTPAPTAGAPPSALPGDRAAVVALLKAQHQARGKDLDNPQPLYYGTRDCPDLPRNAKVLAERKTSKACLGYTPEQLAAQGPIPHCECTHHGQDASVADRARRVDGSGPETLGQGTGKVHPHRRGGEARAQSRPQPPSRWGWGAAPVGGRRAITLATTEATGRGGTRPGETKCIRSDFDSSGLEGGSGEPPTTTATPACGGRVAAAASFPAPYKAGSGDIGMDALDLVARHAPPAPSFEPRRTLPGAWSPQQVVDQQVVDG